MLWVRLKEDIEAIRQRDPAARGSFEVLTCYPGLHALMLHRIAHWLWRMRVYWPARFVGYLARLLTGIEIHPGAVIGRRVLIDHGMGVVIGETAVVGNDCTIYQGATLGGTSLQRGTKRHPTLEEGVVVGAGAKILGPFTVGAGAKVGPNVVVMESVLPGARVVGNPACAVVRLRSERGGQSVADATVASETGASSRVAIDEVHQADLEREDCGA